MGLTMREDSSITKALWEAAKPLSASLPHEFQSGACLNELHATCDVCSQAIADEDFRGEVVPVLGNVISVRAAGYCPACAHLTTFSFRVRGDEGELAMEGQRSDGRWYRNEAEPVAFYPRWRRRLLRWWAGA